MRIAVEWLGEPGLLWVTVPLHATIGDIKQEALHQRPRADILDLERSNACLWIRVGSSLRMDSDRADECGLVDGSCVSVLASQRADL